MTHALSRTIGSAYTEYRPLGPAPAIIPNEPLAYLDPATGEVTLVPAEDFPNVNNALNRWHNVVGELHEASETTQLVGDALSEAIRHATSEDDKTYFRSLHGEVLAWYDEARMRFRAEMDKLDAAVYADANQPYKDKALHNGAKDLMEVMLIRADRRGSERSREKAEHEARMERAGLKLEDGKLRFHGKPNFTTLKSTLLARREPVHVVGYLDRGKVKPTWARFKDKKGTRWDEVMHKDASGKTRVVPDKLKRYVREQASVSNVMEALRLPIGPSLDGSGVLFGLDHIAENMKVDHAGDVLGIPYDISAEAQLMRYSYGASLQEYDAPWKDRKVKVRAEGHAEVDFFSGRAAVKAYLPDKDGCLLTARDFELKEHPLVAMRVVAEASVSGMCGVTLAAEAGLSVQAGPDGEGVTIVGKRGPKHSAVRKPTKMPVFQSEQEPVVAMDAEMNLFAGARADAELNGTLEWRDPTTKERDFVPVASVSVAMGGMLGTGMNAKFQISVLRNGIFRIKCDASLCFGVGSSGGIGFDVDPMEVARFMKCVYFKIAYVNFRNVGIIEKDAYEAMQYGVFIAVQAGTAVVNKVNQTMDAINNALSDAFGILAEENARRKLAEDIIRQCDAIDIARAYNDSCGVALEYSLPETRGMLIYQLMQVSRSGISEAIVGKSLGGDDYLNLQRIAILGILGLSVTKAEFDNVLQHIHERGEKAAGKASLSKIIGDLEAFMSKAPIFIPYPSGYEPHFLKELRKQKASFDRKRAEAHAGEAIETVRSWFEDWSEKLRWLLADELPRGHPLPSVMRSSYPSAVLALSHPRFDTQRQWATYQDRV